MTNNKHINSLDLLRGIAALSVCVYHAQGLFNADGSNFIPHAYLAVDLFFILSGFILVHRYQPMIISNTPISFGKFLYLRLARLYPLFVIATLAGAAFSLIYLYTNQNLGLYFGSWLKALSLNIFMIPYFHGDMLGNGPALYAFAIQSWSILWEIILSALFYFWAKDNSKLKYFAPLPFLLILIVLTANTNTIDGGWQRSDFVIGGLRAFTGFGIGLIIGNLYKNYADIISQQQKSTLVSFAYAITILIIAYICTNEAQNRVIELLILTTGFPIVIFGFAFCNISGLSKSIGKILGDASYSLYLTHTIAIAATNSIITRISFLQPGLLLGIIWTIAMFAASYLIYRIFEVPSRDYLKSLKIYKKTSNANQNMI